MIEFLNTALQAAVPIAFVALGGVVAHRAGILHLGLEGLLLIGAFTAVAVTVKTGSVTLGVLAAIGVNVAVSVVFWALIDILKADVIIAGLGLSLTGLGLTAFLLEAIFDTRGGVRAPHGLAIPVDDNGGLLGLVADLSILGWLLPLLVLATWLVVRRSRVGLRLTAVGEYPFAARSAGVHVGATRCGALCVAGALCALGGADLALASINQFSENMSAGRGYLAFTAVLFGAEHPLGVAAASLFFGLAEALGIQSQLGLRHVLPIQFVLMVPYVLTIVAITVSSAVRARRGSAIPGFAELRES
jgi:simple sugar transport system permease protein